MSSMILVCDEERTRFFLVESLLAYDLISGSLPEELEELFGKVADENGTALDDKWVPLDLDNTYWELANEADEPEDE